jgi:hypothetical protein
MALRPCRQCSMLLPSEAKRCPNCGARTGSAWRRPIVIVPLAVVGLAVIVGGLIFADESFNGSLFDDPPGTPSSGPCTPSDFSVEKVSVSMDGVNANLSGNVVSHCAQASGVELRWTATRDDGTVAFSHTFWPASISNVQAKSAYAFEFSWVAPSGHFSSKVEPVVTKAW